MTSRMLLAITAFALAGLVVLAAHPPASHGLQTVTVGIDVDPTGNKATSLGTIEGCTSIKNNAGREVAVDVYVDEIPSGQDLAGFNYQLNFDATRFKIVGEDHELLLASASGSSVFEIESEGGGIPDTTTPHDAAPVDFGTLEVGPIAGVLGRYTLKVLQGAPDGVAELSLSTLGVFNSQGDNIPIDQIASGTIALGTACPSDLPPPTTPPPKTTPKPTPKPTPPPDTGATPSPETAVLDADMDRVADVDDQCPDTATDASVDASGCSTKQLKQLTQQVKEELLEALAAGLNLDVSLDTVAVGGSTAVIAVFADENDEPVSGVDITFKIKDQPGSDADLKGKAKVTKTSDAEGFAVATLNVGSTPGEIVLSATAEGQTETVKITVIDAGEATPVQSPTTGGEPSPEEGTPAGGEPSPGVETPASGEEEGDGGSGSWPYVVGGLAGALAALALGGWLWWRRRASGDL